VFRNVGNYKSDAGESPKRRYTINVRLTQKLEAVRRYLVDIPPAGKARSQRHPKLPSCAACLGGIAFGNVNVRAQDLTAASASTCMRDEGVYWCPKHPSTGCQLLSQMMTKPKHSTFKALIGQLYP
jgi:hypothetical protein